MTTNNNINNNFIKNSNCITVNTHDLTIGYIGEPIVENINFHLKKGETLALVGANGSGKTTLLKTIAGLIKPLSGDIEVFYQKPLKNPSRVAYLGQFHLTSFLLPLRSYDIIRMARFARHGLLGKLSKEDDKEVINAMSIMNILDLYEKPLNSLSGGQRQRVFLAQAFAKNADLILLDEPASNLDTSSCSLYRKHIHQLASLGKSIIVTTHDISEAVQYDYTMLLAKKVVAYNKSSVVFTKQTLIDTFGIIGNYQNGNFVVIEKEHGH